MIPRRSPRRRFVLPAPATLAATPAILTGPLRERARFALPPLALLTGLALFTAGPSARAATEYWEPTGTTGTNVTGTWTTATATTNWNTDSTGAATPQTFWTNGNDAIFSADAAATGPSTVTLGTAILANSLTFGNSGTVGGTTSPSGATGSYVFTNGNTLTLGSATGTGTAITMSPGVGAVTFNGVVQFGGATSVADTFSVANNSSSLLTFGGTVGSNNGNSLVLSITGTGAGGVTFTGAIVNNFASPNGGGRNTTLVINTTGTAGATAVTTLSNTGDFFRGTTVTSGILATTSNNVLGEDTNQNANSSTISFGAAGQLNLMGTNQGMGALSGVAGALIYNNSNTNDTLTIGNASNGGGTYAGVIENNSNGTSTGTLALTKTGTNTITLSGLNTYSGTTTVNNGTLGLSYAAGNNVLPSGGAVTLSTGGGLALSTATAGQSYTQATGALTASTGPTTLSIAANGTAVPVLTASSFARTNLGTTLVLGTSLGLSSSTTAASEILFTNPAGLTLVGTNTLNNAPTTDATQGVTIVPYFFGGTTGSTGTNFLTYDTTTGLRLLTAAEDTALVAGSTTAAAPVNATVTTSATVTAPTLTVNSLLFTTTGLTLNGTTTALTVNSGAVAESVATGTIGSGFSSLTLGNGEGVITTPTTDVLTINTPIAVTGSGGLTKTGTGTLIIGAVDTYTGATTINQGSLQIGAGGNLAAGSGAITALAGTTLSLNMANGATLANNIVDAGIVSKTLGATLNTLSGNISGTGVVTQSVTGGTLALAGADTYSGATTVFAGNLQAVASTANLTGSNSTALSANSVLTLSGGTLQLRGDANTTFTPAAGSSLTTASTINVDDITAGTTGNVLTLANFNLRTTDATNPTLTVTGGDGYTLKVGALTFSNNGGTQTITSGTAGVTLLGTTVTPASGNNAVLVLGGAGNFTFTGALNSFDTTHNLGLTINSTGVVTLDGSNRLTASTLSDASSPILLNSGTLVLNNATPFNANALGPLSLGSKTASSTAATLLLGGTNAPNSLGIVTAPTGGVTLVAGRAIIAEDTDTGTLTIGGNNSSGTNTFADPITLGATANTGKSISVVEATGGTLAITGVIAANGTDTSAGVTFGDATGANNGIVSLSAANTYVGVTTLASGVLSDAPTTAATDPLGTSSALTFTGGTLQYTANSAARDYSAKIVNSTAPISINTNGQSVTYASALVASNTGGLTKLGTGTLTLSTINAYSGLTLANAGTLTGTATGAFGTGNVTVNPTGIAGTTADAAIVNTTGSIATTAAVTVNTNTATAIGTLNFNGAAPTIGSLAGNGSVVLNSTAGTTLTTGNATNTTFSGVISNGVAAGGLAVQGTGTFTLSGANTYTGATSVNSGALLVNGSVGASGASAGALTVAANATLGGANTGVAGTGMLTVSSAVITGTLAPGATLGATTGTLTLNTTSGLTINGTLAIGVVPGGTGTSLTTNGLLALGSGATLTLTGILDGVNDYDIANYATLGANSAFASSNVPANYMINYAGTTFGGGPDIELDPVTPVPEPSTWVFIGLTAAATGLHLRRRRAQRN